MYLSRVQIKNFRNFADLDVAVGKNVILVGENRVGKSNFIFALRLVLDNSLPDSQRQLKFSDIWDGYTTSNNQQENTIEYNPVVEVHLDFSDFDSDKNLSCLLTDYRLANDHKIARLSFVFHKKEDIEGAPTSEADFEFKIFGGGDNTRSISSQLRRRICLDVLPALRDAESDLSSWRNSPLRPLLDDAVSHIPPESLDDMAQAINEATQKMVGFESINMLETELRTQMEKLAGAYHDIKAKFGFTPTNPLRLFRTLRLFIDEGQRSLGDASLGSANLAFLTLKFAEFAWRHQKNERNFTLIAVEEPEAHLHPHLQRKVFGTLLNEATEGRSFIFTTHSPNIASIAPLRSIVMLKSDGEKGTKAYSLANLSLESRELDDLQRYLNTTRAEALFSRGVIFVEGNAEEALIPIFAKNLGYDLDELGITVCSIGGVHFKPYVRFAATLSLPFVVITDWDPDIQNNGWKRSLELIDMLINIWKRCVNDETKRKLRVDEKYLRAAAQRCGVFCNNSTLEIEIAQNPNLLNPILDVLSNQNFGSIRMNRIQKWRDTPSVLDKHQLMLMIGDVSKGRFASQLADAIKGHNPPDYIANAIQHIVEKSSGKSKPS